MSKIDALSILGIRSFDNAHSEIIQFFTPLTLIVGYNGSGKTTVIECLKYAATGDQPPNSKGGAFVHDPQLCGEKEVMAQVKMSFTSASDAKMVITRNLQLSVKKDARSLKTIEGQLLMIKNNERIAVSSRTAELDQITPQYLGVSKAILDNVVFCHQDESLWPLSEPSVLKKKFDEIFEALKYTKAIDNIKILRKKQMEELGKLQVIETHEKENKDKGERAEQRSFQLQKEIEQLAEKSNEMNRQRDEAQQKAREAYDKASHYEIILSKLNGKKIAADSKKESIEDLKSDLEEMQDSDDSLNSMLDQYEQRAQSYQTEMNSRLEKYDQLEKTLQNKSDTLGLKREERGQYESEKNLYEEQLKDRESLVKDVARQQNIRGFDFDLNDARVHEFVDRIAKMARDQNAALENAREESKSEISEAREVLNGLFSQRSTLTQSKTYASGQIKDNDKKIAKYDSSLNSLRVDDGARANLESTVATLRETLQNLKSKAEASDWEQKIREAGQEIRILEERKDKLDSEIVEATRYAKETAELDHLRKSLKDSEHGLNTMMDAHADRLTKVIGTSWQNGDLEVTYQKALDSKSNEIKQAQSKADQLSLQLTQVNYKISNNKQDTKGKFEKVKQYEKEIRDATGEQDLLEYHNALQSAEQNVERQKTDLELSKWYQQCLETLKEWKCCRLCKRTFEDQQELNKFEGSLRNQIEQANIKEMTEDLEQAEADLRTLRAVAPSFGNWRALTQTEIPAVKRELLKLEAEHKAAVSQVEEADSQVKNLESAKRDLEVVGNNVKSISKYRNEIQSYQEKIEALSQMPSKPQQSRGLEAIRDDQKTANEQWKAAQKKINDLRIDRESSQTTISNKEIEVRDADQKLRETISQLKERDSVHTQREELVQLNQEQRGKISEIEEKLRQLEPQVSQYQVRLEDTERRAEGKQKQLQDEAATLNANREALKNAQNQIDSYIRRGGPNQLARVEKEIETNLEEQKKLKDERTEITKEINTIKQQAENHGAMKRSIERNLKYRKDSAALDELLKEIAELETQYVGSEREKYQQEAEQWEMKRNAFAAEASSLLGEAKSRDNQLKDLLEDWNTDYRDAKKNYLEASVKVQTTKAAVEDLARYGGALDKTIMKYHSLKMDEINTVIDELWRKTYQGTDVDTILIRSDNTNAKSTKSYNYRVCMVKQEAEMDMRGRCSAGQKVLASIIIRLALAECFGVSCGMIALDEPTTNLDRDNIRSLAMALHDIIKTRQQQSNFQLIVITHDEEFLHFMRCRDFCDYYYRISRSENQKSEIRRQKLSEVM